MSLKNIFKLLAKAAPVIIANAPVIIRTAKEIRKAMRPRPRT